MRVVKIVVGLFIFLVVFFGACDGMSCVNDCTYSCQKSCDSRKQEKENTKQFEKSSIDFNIKDTLNPDRVYTLKGILSYWNGITSHYRQNYYLPDKDSEWIKNKLDFGGVFDDKDGYTFVGVYDTPDTTGTKIINNNYEWATPLTTYCDNHGNKRSYGFYSIWEPIDVNVKFEIDISKTNDRALNSLRLNGLNYGTKLSDAHADLASGLSTLTPSNPDYNFIGWATNNGTIVEAGDINVILDKTLFDLGDGLKEINLTFRAVFEKGKGTVVFHYGEDYNKSYTLTAVVGNNAPWNLVETTNDVRKIVDFMYWSSSPTDRTQWTGRVEKDETLHLYAVLEETKKVYLQFPNENFSIEVKVYKKNGVVKKVVGNTVVAIDEHNSTPIWGWYPSSLYEPGTQVSVNSSGKIAFDYNKLEEGYTYYARYLE